MTFKEYRKWCNERTVDGCWGMIEAIVCIDIMRTVEKIPYWKREKYWGKEYKCDVINEIIKPINKKIAELN